MKRVIARNHVNFFRLAILTPFLICFVLSNASAKEITLKAISAWPIQDLGNDLFRKYIERVNKEGAGVVKITFIGGPEAAPVTEQPELIKRGIFDLGLTTPNYYAGMVPAALSCYVGVNNLKEFRDSGYWAVFDKMHREKMGVTTLGVLWQGDGYGLFLRKPISTSSLKGLRVRGFPLVQGVIEQLGGVHTFIPLQELFSSIEKGVIDGSFSSVLSGELAGMHEVAPNFVLPLIPWTTSGDIMMKAQSWDTLPVPAKTTMMKVLMDMEPGVIPYYRSVQEKSIERMVKKGCKLVELPPPEAAKMMQIGLTAPWTFIIKGDPEWATKLKDTLPSYLQPK